MATLSGRTIGNYQIENELGRGAMGVVYKAKQLSMDRYVALKFLPKRLAQDERILQRFMREARAAGQLSHPHVVSVHDVGVLEGFHYIAMELVDGNSVQSHIRERGPFSEKDALEIARQIAEALKYAHSRNILHRDIKPDNFLIDSHKRVRLADLGLARVQSPEHSKEAELTQDGTALGTPHYMSPEQCKGEHLDGRSDIYGLGASLYMMVSNKTPYDAATAAAVMVKVITEPPKSLKKACPNLTPGFVALVEKMMAKDPAKRFPDAQHVIEAIEKVKAGTYKVPADHHSKPHSHPHPPAPGRLAHAPRYKLVLIGAGAAVLALIGLGILVNNKKKSDANNVVQSENKEGVKEETNANIPPVATPTETKAVAGKEVKAPTPDVVAKKDDNDLERERPEVFKKIRELEEEIRALNKRDPSAVISRAEELIRTHPRTRFRLQPRIDELRKGYAKLKQDYAEARAESEKQYKAGDKGKAFQAFLKFVAEYKDTPQAVEWTKQVQAMFSAEMRAEALKVANAGDFAKAENILQSLLKNLPAEQHPAINKDLDKVLAEKKRVIAEQQADEKRIAELQTRARTAVLEAEMPSGKRYDIAKATSLINAELGLFKTESARKTAEALMQVYERAGEVVRRVKLSVNGKSGIELPSLGNYKVACVVQKWEEAALEFKPANLTPQSLTLKNVLPENILELAKKVSIGTGSSSADQFDLGSLAFAIGLDTVAAQAFEKVSNDAGFQQAASVAKRFLKAEPLSSAPSDDREDDARKLFTELLNARQAKDQAQVLKLSAKMVVDFADTQFVKDNLKQIQQAGTPGSDVVEPAAAPATTAANEEAAAVELKKLGFTSISGDWQLDKTVKGGFTTQIGGRLEAELHDGAATLTYALDEGAELHLYARSDGDLPAAVRARERYLDYKIEVGEGYGVHATKANVDVYRDKSAGQTAIGTRGNMERQAVPIKIESFTLPPGPHTITLNVRGDELLILVDDKQFKSKDKLRDVGPFVLKVSGRAKIANLRLAK